MTGISRLIREIHRRSLWQVLLVYLGASWGVLEAADQIVDRLALPSWIYGAALVLLLVGLPIVLGTAFVQEGTPVDPPGGGGREPAGAKPVRADRRRGAIAGGHRLLTWRNAILGGVFAAAAWGVVVSGWLLLRPETGEAEAAAADRRSIAVLPFTSVHTDEESEAFTTGIHDDILTQLSKIGSLKVISRTSVMQYRETQKTIRDIGRELDVATVLEGGVQRSGNRVRLNVQLIDAHSDEHIWAETYDEELTAANVFAIQSDVARRIADALKATLTPEVSARIERKPTENLAAYDLYTRGRYLLTNKSTREAWEEARALFRRALEEDRGFAPAHAGEAEAIISLLARGYLAEQQALPAARAAAERALSLDESLAEAHTALGRVLEWEHRQEEAEASYRRAIELNPGEAVARRRYAALLLDLGKVREAVGEARRAVEVDPLSVGTRVALASTLFFARDYEGAAAEARAVLQMEPEDADAFYELGYALVMKGEHGEGVRALRRAAELNPEDPYLHSGVAWGYARAGKRDSALLALRKAEARGVPLKESAIVYGELGDRDRGIELLERAAREEPATLLRVKTDQTADSLRADPRFDKLLREASAGR